jgi:hypothetical protein
MNYPKTPHCRIGLNVRLQIVMIMLSHDSIARMSNQPVRSTAVDDRTGEGWQ